MINVPEYKHINDTSPIVAPASLQSTTNNLVSNNYYTFSPKVSLKTNLTSNMFYDGKFNFWVSIIPDHKTNTFQLEILGEKLNNKNLNADVFTTIKINNKNTNLGRTEFRFSMYERKIHSTELKTKLSDLKTISIDIKANPSSWQMFQSKYDFHILWDNDENYKKDIQIKGNETLNLDFKTAYTFFFQWRNQNKKYCVKNKT